MRDILSKKATIIYIFRYSKSVRIIKMFSTSQIYWFVDFSAYSPERATVAAVLRTTIAVASAIAGRVARAVAGLVAGSVAVTVTVVVVRRVLSNLRVLVVANNAAAIGGVGKSTFRVCAIDSDRAADDLLVTLEVEKDVLLGHAIDVTRIISGDISNAATGGVLVGVGTAKSVLLAERVVLITKICAAVSNGAVLENTESVGGVGNESREGDLSLDSLAGHLGKLNKAGVVDLANSVLSLLASGRFVGNFDGSVLLVLVVPSALVNIIVIIVVRVAVAVVAVGRRTVTPLSGLSSGEEHSSDGGNSLHFRKSCFKFYKN